MPECYTHSLVGNRALMRSGQLISSFAPFLAGTNGPDPFFMYQFSQKSKKYNLPKLAEMMHRENTGLFLNTLAHYATTPAQQCYVLGFLAHYATDCVMHPYLEAVHKQISATQPISYKTFETAIDSKLYFNDYRTRAVPMHMGTPVLITEDLAQVTTLLHNSIREVYDIDIPTVVLADAFHHLLRMRKILFSKSRLKRTLAFAANIFSSGKSSLGKMPDYMQPGQAISTLPTAWENPYTMEEKHTTLDDIVSEAIESSSICISGTMKFWLGKVNAEQLAGLLANNDYYTGQPIKKTMIDPIPNTENISINKLSSGISEPEEPTIAEWKKS